MVSDAGRGAVLRLWQRDGKWHEQVLGEFVAPAHAQVVDLDGDGRLDVVVAEMGEMRPTGEPVGKVVVLLGEPDGSFLRRDLVEGLGRVTDVRAADLDGDGDMDLAVAVFGTNNIGAIFWMENRDGAMYRRPLVPLAGALGIEPVDLDGDGLLDLVTLVSQEHEMVLAFRTLGGGRSDRSNWRARRAIFGSTRCVRSTTGRRHRLLFTNGDAFDLQADPSPTTACSGWRTGNMEFAAHDIGRFYGGGDRGQGHRRRRRPRHRGQQLGQLLARPARTGRYENDGHQNFTAHGIASEPAGLTSLWLADANGDGRLDILAGAFRMDLLQEMLGMPVNEDTRPAPPKGRAKEHPRLLVFENLSRDGAP